MLNCEQAVAHVGESKQVDVTSWIRNKKDQYSIGHSSMDSNQQKRSYQEK